MPNNNSVHCVGLGLGTLGIAVFLVVKVTQREYRKPSSLIRAHTMGQHKWRGELVLVLTRNHIHHPSGMHSTRRSGAFVSLSGKHGTYAP